MLRRSVQCCRLDSRSKIGGIGGKFTSERRRGAKDRYRCPVTAGTGSAWRGCRRSHSRLETRNTPNSSRYGCLWHPTYSTSGQGSIFNCCGAKSRYLCPVTTNTDLVWHSVAWPPPQVTVGQKLETDQILANIVYSKNRIILLI